MPTGKINIEYANYGSTDGNVCSDITSSTKDCGDENSKEIVKSKCNEKRKCSVLASNEVFKDRCAGIIKYLEVKFTCV